MPGTIDHVNVSLKIDALLLSALDLSTAQDPLLISLLSNLSNGTGAGQASQFWRDTRTLGPAATENIDLAGSLVNAFGVTVTFTKIKFLFVRADPANNVANNVNVQRAAANGFVWFLAVSDGFFLAPGAWAAWFDPAGVTVTAGTGDLLTITNGAGSNSVNYDIVIVGTD